MNIIQVETQVVWAPTTTQDSFSATTLSETLDLCYVSSSHIHFACQAFNFHISGLLEINESIKDITSSDIMMNLMCSRDTECSVAASAKFNKESKFTEIETLLRLMQGVIVIALCYKGWQS
jgi:hypothetical protein